MKKRLFTTITVLCLMFSVLAFQAGATETTEPTNVPRDPGYCGETMTWEYKDGTLTIIGTGGMDDFPEGAPWAQHKDEVTELVLSDGITYIGANAFRDFDALKTADFGSDLYEMGKEAFLSCDALTTVYLPASFKVFGESCFMSCKNLTEFHCEGRFPSFRQNCLWDTYATIYFPAERPWGVEYIRQLEEAFNGRIEFLASDGSDPYEPTEATEPTEAPTEPETTPPTTEVPTEPVTEPTEVPTEPTVTETTAAPETEPDTRASEPESPTEPEKDGSGSGWTGFLIIGIVAALLLAGALIFGRGGKRGKYAR